ncbi:MAG: alpha/beta fold hydrolase [Thermoanaerobaculia bacterium]
MSGVDLFEERIAIPGTPESGESSFLAVRLARPREARRAPFTFLYVHGFGSHQSGEKAAFFRDCAISEGLPFCSFDFQGHGESGGEMRTLTFTRNLSDLTRVHDHLAEIGLGTVVLIGSSMGGATALWHAARRPAQVLASLLIAPAVGMGRGLERWAGPERLARWREEGVLRYSSELVEAELGWELIADLRRYDLEVLSSSYRTPTLILQGVKDDTVDYREVARFVARSPGGLFKLRLYPDGDHRLNGRKEELWSEMRDFLIAHRLLSASSVT